MPTPSCSLLILSVAGACAAAPPERTLTVDAVALIRGEELRGSAQHVVTHEGLEYHFASAENQAAFASDPQRFAVADGGACGRMGPLSGLGDARRFAVHAGRIYFFASDACRDTFLKQPQRYIESDDPRPEAPPAARAQGAAALDRAMRWAGGQQRLADLKSYRQTYTRKQESGGQEWTVVDRLSVQLPDAFALEQSWDESTFSTVRTAGGAAMAGAKGRERIAASRARAFDRQLARELVVILCAHARGESGKTMFVAADGEARVGESEAEFVIVWLNGARSRLAIEKSTGRPLQIAYHGRGTRSQMGAVERRFTRFATVDGVQLPVAFTSWFEGQERPADAVALDAFEINPALASELFDLGR